MYIPALDQKEKRNWNFFEDLCTSSLVLLITTVPLEKTIFLTPFSVMLITKIIDLMLCTLPICVDMLIVCRSLSLYLISLEQLFSPVFTLNTKISFLDLKAETCLYPAREFPQNLHFHKIDSIPEERKQSSFAPM